MVLWTEHYGEWPGSDAVEVLLEANRNMSAGVGECNPVFLPVTILDIDCITLIARRRNSTFVFKWKMA
jgi:hypothetical protein